LAGIGQDLKKIYIDETKIVENASLCTAQVCFASFLSGGFTTMTVINTPEKKLAKHTSVHCNSTRVSTQPIAYIASKIRPL
jgi:hypothetical protein